MAVPEPVGSVKVSNNYMYQRAHFTPPFLAEQTLQWIETATEIIKTSLIKKYPEN